VMVAMRVDRAMRIDVPAAQVPLRGRLLELRTPARRARRHGARVDRTTVGMVRADERAALEAQTAVVEVVVVKVIDRCAKRSRAHERVQVLVLEEDLHSGGRLVAVVLADDALTRLRVV